MDLNLLQILHSCRFITKQANSTNVHFSNAWRSLQSGEMQIKKLLKCKALVQVPSLLSV